MLQKVEELNNGRGALSWLVPFVVDGAVLGRLRPEFADELVSCGGGVFCFEQDSGSAGAGQQQQQQPRRTLALRADLTTCEQRTAAVAPVMRALRDAGVVRGWRDETYPLGPAFDAPPALLVERAAAPYLGMRSYGVHVNGEARALEEGAGWLCGECWRLRASAAA